MERKDTDKPKASLIQAWEDWDEAPKAQTNDSPKLCKIDNPDCEACQ